MKQPKINHPKPIHSRKFLNSKRGTAFISTQANSNMSYVGGSVKIADCYQVITLEFDCSLEGSRDERSVKERVKKIDCIISEFQKLREFLIASEKAYAEKADEVKEWRESFRNELVVGE